MVGFDDIDKRFQSKPKQGPIVLKCRNCGCGDSTVVSRVPKWCSNNEATALCDMCYNNVFNPSAPDLLQEHNKAKDEWGKQRYCGIILQGITVGIPSLGISVPTIVGYDDSLPCVWFNDDNVPHLGGRVAILSNGAKIVVLDDRIKNPDDKAPLPHVVRVVPRSKHNEPWGPYGDIENSDTPTKG